MPLFRRNSSKERKQSTSTESRSDDSSINPSLFERLSRRMSSGSDIKNQADSDDGSQSPHPVNPAASPTSPTHAQHSTPTTEITPQRSRSHSSYRQRSSSRSAPTPRQDGTNPPSSAPPEPEHVEGGLRKDDVEHLFSGAPHFMLEKGRRGRYFPQAYFPWDHELDITDLQDRPYLKHESFALATMHAHLPVPDEVNWKPGMPHPGGIYLDTTETGKRPMFDLGIYERPNMMGVQGLENGTMALRAYLERPVADGLKQASDGREHGKDVDVAEDPKSPGGTTELILEHMSASEAFKVLAHDGGDAKIGKHAPRHDRVELTKGGAKAWKAVGVRNLDIDAISERLCYISKLREEVVAKGWRYTVLNVMTEAQMGEYLFGELLYPPSKIVDGKSGSRDLKVQIEALVKVLTTPGVWLDFSMPRERLLFVQTLYTTRKEDQGVPDHHGILPGEKRRWNLIQLVLAIELVIRLDAALRLGVAMHEIDITPQEIHHFNKLRNLKVDWDLVVARRFLDLGYAKKIPISPNVASETEQSRSPPQSPHHEHHGFLDKFKRSISFAEKEQEDSTYTLAILPRQPRVMGEGLIRFGTHLKWPTIDSVENSLRSKLGVPHEQREEMLARGVESLHHERIGAYDSDNACVELRSASQKTVGGPLSHAWLGGFIIPGYISSDLLMCALLENDIEGRPLGTLGNKAWPRAGFVWRGRSWWSKACIAGLVMSPSEGTVERMGWMSLPAGATPVDTKTGKVLGDGWVLVKTYEPKQTRRGHRIHDGEALSKESSPLGIGHGKVSSNEFNMVTDHVLNDLTRLNITKVQLIVEEPEERHDSKGEKVRYSAAVLADLAEEGNQKTQSTVIPLRYDVRFVAGHPCRPPHGHATAPQGQGEHRHPVHKHLEHLPAHPLHKSYKYVTKSVAEVLELEATDWLPELHDKEASSVWIVDARGGSAVKEAEQGEEEKVLGVGGQGAKRAILVRAWCSKVGRDAMVSRVGRQCVGCAVREARALEVGIVIRVGEVVR